MVDAYEDDICILILVGKYPEMLAIVHNTFGDDNHEILARNMN